MALPAQVLSAALPHPDWHNAPVELVAALVTLPPSRLAVRWIRLEV